VRALGLSGAYCGAVKPARVSGVIGEAIALRRAQTGAARALRTQQVKVAGKGFAAGLRFERTVLFAPRFARLDSLFTGRGFLRKMAFSHAAPSPENRCFVRLGLA
jgi:hypothetical protein